MKLNKQLMFLLFFPYYDFLLSFCTFALVLFFVMNQYDSDAYC